jgi:hypothetical protein
MIRKKLKIPLTTQSLQKLEKKNGRLQKLIRTKLKNSKLTKKIKKCFKFTKQNCEDLME